MGCVLYNLLAQFRETVLPRSWFERRLRAVRDFAFLVGADLIAQGRRVRIWFAMPGPDRAEFLRRLRTMSEGIADCGAVEIESNRPVSNPSRPNHQSEFANRSWSRPIYDSRMGVDYLRAL
jgi:hypothetical protein